MSQFIEHAEYIGHVIELYRELYSAEQPYPICIR